MGDHEALAPSDSAEQRVYVEKEPIRSLRGRLGNLRELTWLAIRECSRLETLDGIEDAIALQSLELWHVPKLDLEAEFTRLATLPRLATLSLESKTLESIPDTVSQLAITHFIIRKCPKLDFERALTALARVPSLRVLEIHEGPKLPLPDALGALRGLEELRLRRCAFTALPSTIEQLARLRYLDASGNKLRALPRSLGALRSLETLDLSYNTALRKLPDSIGEMQRLATLDITYSAIRELPSSMKRLSSLRVLLAPQLESVPPEVFDALRFDKVHLPKPLTGQPKFRALDTSVEELELERLEHVQDDLGDPRVLRVKLRGLEAPLVGLSAMRRLEEAQLEIPAALWQDALSRLRGATRLRRLRLVGTYDVIPTTLPDEIGELKSLERLILGGCHLTALPAAIGDLSRLRELYIANNQLTTLPEELASLRQLEVLEANENPMPEVPACIGRITSLRSLRLITNGARSLPDELAGLVNLQRLELEWQSDELPIVLGRLTGLRELVFMRQGPSDVSVTDFDWAAFLRIIAACPLEKLTLRTAPLKLMPSELDLLTGLVQLDLSYARLRNIPRLDHPRLERFAIMHSFLNPGERVDTSIWRKTEGGPTSSWYMRKPRK